MTVATREQFRYPIATFEGGGDDRVEAQENALERLDDETDTLESAVVVAHRHDDSCYELASDNECDVETACPPGELLDLLVTYIREWE